MPREESEKFNGVVLSGAQREALTKYLKSVLGDDYYAMTDNFFMSVWNSDAQYKIFLARRCLNFMYSIYRAKYGTPGMLSDHNFYSDGALLANAREIAESYIKCGVMPEILIVDDILIHGRTLTALISNFIENVYRHLKDMGVEKEKSDIEDIILDSITVRTIVRSANPLLISGNYRRCLKYRADRSDIWSNVRWHEFSSRISLLVGEGYFCNTSFVLSLYENDNTDLHLQFENAAKKLGFKKNHWNNACTGDAWVKPLTDFSGDVFAFYTVRIIQNAVDRKFRIIPFVIMSDISHDPSEMSGKYSKVYELIEKHFGNFDIRSRIRLEALYLLLSHNLLLLLAQQIKEKIFLKKYLDIDKIALNFKIVYPNGFDNNFVNEVAEIERPLLDLNEMNEFILQSAADSLPLFDNNGANPENTNSGCISELEDILAQEGEEREREAYLVYTGKRRIISGTGKKPISGLMRQISGSDVSETIGALLRYMDMGAASVNTRTINGKCSCVFHAGEQSLFIRVRRYARELPVLIAMERDCLYSGSEIKKRIDKFYGDDPVHALKLKEFLNILYSSGQCLSDWDINFFNWTEITDEVRSRSKDNNEDMVLSQMFLNAAERMDDLERYFSMFPQDVF